MNGKRKWREVERTEKEMGGGLTEAEKKEKTV